MLASMASLIFWALVLEVPDQFHGTDGLEIDVAEPFGVRPDVFGH